MMTVFNSKCFTADVGSTDVFVDGVKIPHYLEDVNHSPDGFSWGYQGSGCAQLAYAILKALCNEAIARKYYQHYKREIIARQPQDQPLNILVSDVALWLQMQDRNDTDEDFSEYLKENEYYNIRNINGMWCAISNFIFTKGVVVGLTYTGYDHRYCFKSLSDAMSALNEWDGRSDLTQSEGCIKRKPTLEEMGYEPDQVL